LVPDFAQRRLIKLSPSAGHPCARRSCLHWRNATTLFEVP
jgi:hypothetical protein